MLAALNRRRLGLRLREIERHHRATIAEIEVARSTGTRTEDALQAEEDLAGARFNAELVSAAQWGRDHAVISASSWELVRDLAAKCGITLSDAIGGGQPSAVSGSRGERRNRSRLRSWVGRLTRACHRRAALLRISAARDRIRLASIRRRRRALREHRAGELTAGEAATRLREAVIQEQAGLLRTHRLAYRAGLITHDELIKAIGDAEGVVQQLGSRRSADG